MIRLVSMGAPPLGYRLRGSNGFGDWIPARGPE